MKRRIFTLGLIIFLAVLILGGCGHTSCRDGQVELSVSAYSGQGKTASGRPTGPGICACGPRYPFGTRFDIPGVGTCVCYDRGSAVTNNHLDIWVPSWEEAKAFGRKTLTVTVHCPTRNGDDHDK